MAEKKRRDWVWVTRDPGSKSEWVEVWPGHIKPRISNFIGGYLQTGHAQHIVVCPEELQKRTGLAVQPGACLKVRIRMEVIDEAGEEKR